VDLDTVWAEADVISLHCPLTDANRNLLDAADAGALQARCDHGEHGARRAD
jgi:phosphoglycerate dehydrogenase-like enzyme